MAIVSNPCGDNHGQIPFPHSIPEPNGGVSSSTRCEPPLFATDGVIHPSRSTCSLTAAQHYTGLKWRVLPQIPETKRPYTQWKGLQSHIGGFSQPFIEELWGQMYPEAGVLLMPGAGSGVVVIDCDGQAAYETLGERLGEIPITPSVKSGNPDPYRVHLLFSAPPDLHTYSKITPWHSELEFRGETGLAVLPPSRHASGNRYVWLPGRSPDEIPLAPLPEPIVREWAIYHEKRTAGSRTAVPSRRQSPPRACHAEMPKTGTTPSVMSLNGISYSTKLFLLRRFADGPNWNHRLFTAACDLAGNGVPLETATTYLINGADPWNDEEAHRAKQTIASAYSESRLPGQILSLKQQLFGHSARVLARPGEEAQQ